MATYNGSSFIREQLDSVLQQLAPSDEIVIVDDGSRDETSRIIESYNDQRIRFFQNAQNQGVVRTFSRALELCTGDIIFLCDQDDIWLPGRVNTVVQAFMSELSAQIVINDAIVIDDRGLEIMPSYYADRGVFTDSIARNLIKSKFHGCTMAIRSNLRDHVLPLNDFHDTWIGMVNRLRGGRVIYLNQKLVAYRRHGKNESFRLSPGKQIIKRIRLLFQICAKAISA